jgi:phage gp29-like protein
MTYNPLPGLDPQRLSQYHDQFRRGYLRNAALMWEQIEDIDDKAKTVIPKRKKAVPRHGYEIVISEGAEKDARAQKHKDALAAFYDGLVVTDALDLNKRGGVPMLLRQMLDAVGKRYAVHELIWTFRGGKIGAEARFVPLWFCENTTGRLRYLETDFALNGVEMLPGEWMATVGDGLMAATAVAYMYKRMPLRDWLIYGSRLGGVQGQTNATKGSDEWNTLATAVANLGLDLSILTSKDSEIKGIDVSAKGELPYPGLVDLMNRAIAALWRGGDLSTISGGQDSSGASLQGEETDVLEEDDAELLTETLNAQLDRYVIQYLFGEEPLAWIKIKTGQRQDIKQDIEVDRFLSEQGFPMSAQALATRYGRTLPAEDETLLTPRQVPGAAAPVLPLPNEQPAPASRNAQLEQAVRATLDTRADLVAPWLERLAALDVDGRLTDAEWLAEAERLVASLADLLTPEAVAALSKPLETLVGGAIEQEAAGRGQESVGRSQGAGGGQ